MVGCGGGRLCGEKVEDLAMVRWTLITFGLVVMGRMPRQLIPHVLFWLVRRASRAHVHHDCRPHPPPTHTPTPQHPPTLQPAPLQFRPGQKQRARVLGFRPMDGLAVLSLKTSVVDQNIMSLAGGL